MEASSKRHALEGITENEKTGQTGGSAGGGAAIVGTGSRAALSRGPFVSSLRSLPYHETRTSIFFGCSSGSLVIVTCSTPLVSSAVIVFGSTVSGSETLRETLP